MGEAIAGLEVPVACWRTNLTSQVMRSSLLGVDKAHCRLGVACLLKRDAGLMISPLLEGRLVVGRLDRHTFLEEKRYTTDLLHSPNKGLYMCENPYLR